MTRFRPYDLYVGGLKCPEVRPYDLLVRGLDCALRVSLEGV